MLYLLVIFAFVVVIAAPNVLAFFEGRSGSSGAHKAMLLCGVVGLLSLIAMVVSAFMLGMMLIAATSNSTQAHVFKISACICAISSLGSVLLYSIYAQRRGARHT